LPRVFGRAILGPPKTRGIPAAPLSGRSRQKLRCSGRNNGRKPLPKSNEKIKIQVGNAFLPTDQLDIFILYGRENHIHLSRFYLPQKNGYAVSRRIFPREKRSINCFLQIFHINDKRYFNFNLPCIH